MLKLLILDLHILLHQQESTHRGFTLDDALALASPKVSVVKVDSDSELSHAKTRQASVPQQ
jgi:hypothetical protein